MEAMTVPFFSIAGMIFTLICSILVPVFVWIRMEKAWKKSSTAILFGTVGFIVPQLIIRSPVLSVLSAFPFYTAFAQNNTVLFYFLLASTAAIFETAGRLFVLKVFIKKITYKNSVAAGFGHGMSEAVILVGLSTVINLIMSLAINSQLFSLGSSMYQATISLSQEKSSLFFAAGVERIGTMCFHVMITVLLAYFVQKNRTVIGVALCLILHTAVDFVTVTLSGNGVSVWMIEGMILLVGALGVATVAVMRRFFRPEDAQAGSVNQSESV